MKLYLLLFSLFLVTPSLLGAEKNPLPRFVSLKPSEVNQRVGPGPTYPVAWIYVKAGLPVEVIAEFDNWRKIRDREGTEGWVHQSMLCPKRHAIIQEKETLMYPIEDTQSPPLVRLQQGVVIELLKCQGDWCQIRTHGFKGWIQRIFLWGLYPHEVIG
jgi:SH3-like domain-containing protein